ncbi:MAG: redoxin domain-containing protein, partial [Planctomycetota bacterium]|nr:redoxin domain-containing protein [Planctomycetota bacterium]
DGKTVPPHPSFSPRWRSRAEELARSFLMGITTLLLSAVLIVTAPSASAVQIRSDQPSAETLQSSERSTLPTFAQDRLSELALTDVTGARRVPFDLAGPGLVVVAFVSTACPIANASVPEIRRLHEAVKGVGGRFFAVHPMLGTTAESASAHAKERRLEMPILLDPDQRLVREFKGTVVPEVFILTRESDVWTLRYRGPLDNLYAEIGRRRRNATKAYARDVVSQIVSGRPVSVTSRPAVGCLIEENGKETP